MYTSESNFDAIEDHLGYPTGESGDTQTKDYAWCCCSPDHGADIVIGPLTNYNAINVSTLDLLASPARTQD